MLVQLASSEAQASFPLFSLCSSPPIITTVRRLQGTFLGCREDPHRLIMASFFQQQIQCRQMVPGDSAGVPCPDTTTPAGPSTESPNPPNWNQAIVCPCKSNLERSARISQEKSPSCCNHLCEIFCCTNPSMPHRILALFQLLLKHRQEQHFPNEQLI